MKRVFQILAVLLAIGALGQAAHQALAGSEASSGKERSSGHEPGV
jgi:hypothetical protein